MDSTHEAPGPDRARLAPGDERPSSAPEIAVRHLEELIFNGDLEAGDTLPSESQLAASLGLSRLTVREAVRSLRARGLIEVAHGRRSIIAHPNARPLSDFFSASVRRDSRSLLELLEVRLALEVHTAQLAATRATAQDLAAIAAHLDTMRRSTHDEAAFSDADISFHAAIAAASGNSMFSFLLEGMNGPAHLSRMESLRGLHTRRRSIDELFNTHADIYSSLLERDGRAASARMRSHLLETRHDLRAAFSLS